MVSKKKFFLAGFVSIVVIPSILILSIITIILFAPDLGGSVSYNADLAQVADPEGIEWIMERESIVNLTTSDFDSVPSIYAMIIVIISDDSKNSSWFEISKAEYEFLVAYDYVDSKGRIGFPRHFFFSDELFRLEYGKSTS